MIQLQIPKKLSQLESILPPIKKSKHWLKKNYNNNRELRLMIINKNFGNLRKFLRAISKVCYKNASLFGIRKITGVHVKKGTPNRKNIIRNQINALESSLSENQISNFCLKLVQSSHLSAALLREREERMSKCFKMLKLAPYLNYINDTLDETEYGLRTGNLRDAIRFEKLKLAPLSGKHGRLTNLKIGQRYTFTGMYFRSSFKNFKTHYNPLIILNSIKYRRVLMVRHLTLNYTKSFRKLGKLKNKDVIQFSAKLIGKHRLGYPTKIKLLHKVHNHPYSPLPVDSNTAMVGYSMAENGSATDKHGFEKEYKEWSQGHKIKNVVPNGMFGEKRLNRIMDDNYLFYDLKWIKRISRHEKAESSLGVFVIGTINDLLNNTHCDGNLSLTSYINETFHKHYKSIKDYQLKPIIKKINQLNLAKEWYLRMLELLKFHLDTWDYQYLTETLKGHTGTLDQYKYQTRNLRHLIDQGSPMPDKFGYSAFYQYK